MGRDPLSSVQGLNLTFTFQRMTIRDTLGSVQGLDLTLPFQIFQMVTSLLRNDLNALSFFFFSFNSDEISVSIFI